MTVEQGVQIKLNMQYQEEDLGSPLHVALINGREEMYVHEDAAKRVRGGQAVRNQYNERVASWVLLPRVKQQDVDRANAHLMILK